MPFSAVAEVKDAKECEKMPNLQIDNDLAAVLEQESEPVDQVARELIVFELYRRGTISGGKAAQLLGMDRYAFIKRASSLGIPYFNLTPEESRAEVQALQRSEQSTNSPHPRPLSLPRERGETALGLG
jgi:predicted HTH domain antitoxin